MERSRLTVFKSETGWDRELRKERRVELRDGAREQEKDRRAGLRDGAREQEKERRVGLRD